MLVGPSLSLAAAVRTGACALGSVLPRLLSTAGGAGDSCGAFRRLLSALAAEPLGYPSKEKETFQYTVLRTPLMTEGQLAAHEIPRSLLPFAQRLGQMGGLRSASAESIYEAAAMAARQGQPLAIFMGTGGTEGAALDVVRQYHREFCKAQQVAAGELPHEPLACSTGNSVPPLILVAHPWSNSLPSALETLARLQQDGLRGRVIYLGSGAAHDEGWATLQRALQGARVWHQLHRSRIGLVGAPSDWLVASVPSAATLASSWGPRLLDVDMRELLGGLWGGGHFKKQEVDEVIHDILHCGPGPSPSSDAAECASCGTPGTVDAETAAKVYLALRKLVDAHQLSCLTIRCFDIVTAKETTGCYALARLLDEGVIAGCEGDVCSALGMLFGRLMIGQVPWMANVCQVVPADGIVKLAHCTIARSLLKSYEPTTHFESGLGVAFKGAVPPGAVTLLRIGGRALDQLWLEEGYVLQDCREGKEWSPQLCRTQVRVSLLGGRPAVEELLQWPLGNHLVMLRGHQKWVLEEWFRTFGPGAK